MVDRKRLIRRVILIAYFIASFFAFLFMLFPFDMVKAKIVSEVHRRTPFELNVTRMSPLFFNQFILNDVVLSEKSGKVLFESQQVKLSVSLLGLLRDHLSLDMKARAYGGDLIIKAQQRPGRQYIFLDASGIDVASYGLLKNAGFHISGKLNGNIELTNDTGKGKLWMKGLISRDLRVKGFSIPDVEFDQCWFESDIKGDKLTIRKLELDGKELKIQCQGDAVLRERGLLNLSVKVKLSERLARDQQGLLSLLKNRDSDGFYHFGLGGTLDLPVPRL